VTLICPPERAECEQLLHFETVLVDLAARFINLPSGKVDDEIIDAQRSICECIGVGLSALWQWETSDPEICVLTHLYRPLGGPPVPERMVARENFPWCLDQAMAERTIVLSSVEDAPPEAAKDAEGWRHFSIKTVVMLPLSAGGGRPFGVLSFNDMEAERQWSPMVVKRLELVGTFFANALARKRADEALCRSEARLQLAADSAGVGMWSLNLQSNCFWATDKARQLFDFAVDEVITFERFAQNVHPDDLAIVQETIDRLITTNEEQPVEYRIVSNSGSDVRWMASRARLRCQVPGETDCVIMGVTVDITARKEAEAELTDALAEVRRLRDHLEAENIYLKQEVRSVHGGGRIVATSQAMRQVLVQAEQVAPTNSTVLLLGETGTGKGMLAAMIHDLSKRRRQMLVSVNCAALPASLIESELFGREKGAYTGALSKQVGRFEMANGSTLFLDEIAEMPIEIQTKLLRVLEEKSIERLGSPESIPVDVRIIAATNQELAEAVRQGRFREDLYYRLNVFPITVPPLRHRPGDIPLLVSATMAELSETMGVSVDMVRDKDMAELVRYTWPGNVRELRNLVERALIVSTGRTLAIPSLTATASAAGRQPLRIVETEHIRNVLELCGWRIRGNGGAAEILELKPTTLESRMKKLGIRRPG